MVYENIDGMRIVELPVQNFEIVMVDARKKSAATNNYANAGFFGTYHEGGEAFTLPAGQKNIAQNEANFTAINLCLTPAVGIIKIIFMVIAYQHLLSRMAKPM